MNGISSFLFLFAIFITLIDGIEPDCKVIVAWNGSDHPSCGSKNDPCLSLTQDVLQMRSICIDGTGTDSFFPVFFNSSISLAHVPLTLVGIGEQKPFVRCGNLAAKLQLKSMTSIQIERINFDHCDGDMFDFENTSKLILKDCNFDHIGSNSFKFSQISGIFVINSTGFSGGKTNILMVTKDAQVILLHITATNGQLTFQIVADSSDVAINTTSASLAFLSNGLSSLSMADNLMPFSTISMGNRDGETSLQLEMVENNINLMEIDHKNCSILSIGNSFGKIHLENPSNSNFLYNDIEDSFFLEHSNSMESTINFMLNRFKGRLSYFSHFTSGKVQFDGDFFEGAGISAFFVKSAAQMSLSYCDFIGKDYGVDSLFGIDSRASLPVISINNCTFQGNFIADSGSGIKISGGGPSTVIKGCSFADLRVLARGAAIYSESEVNVLDSTFRNNSAAFEGDHIWSIHSGQIDSNLFFSGKNPLVLSRPLASDIPNTVQCSDGLILISEEEDLKADYKCSPCSIGYYTVVSGKFSNGSAINPQCLEIPDEMTQGISGILKVRSDSWCVVYKSEIHCRSCRSNYCKSEDYPFGGDACKSHRQGILCGECAPGTTVGIFSFDCVDQSKCNKIWIVSIIVRVLLFPTIIFIIGERIRMAEWKIFLYFIQTFPLVAPDVMSNWFPLIREACINSWTQNQITVINIGLDLFVPITCCIVLLLTNNRTKNDNLFSEIDPSRFSRFLKLFASERLRWKYVLVETFLFIYSPLFISVCSIARFTQFIDQTRFFLEPQTSFSFYGYLAYPIGLLLVGFPVFLWALDEDEGQEHINQNWWSPFLYARRTFQILLFSLADGQFRNSIIVCIEIKFRPLVETRHYLLEIVALFFLIFISSASSSSFFQTIFFVTFFVGYISLIILVKSFQCLARSGGEVRHSIIPQRNLHSLMMKSSTTIIG
eukprot:TRINITY_DN2870_c0_g1_i1.p1 TRINITY_DN2870_c0_g1~~TRINITY_DN2870_c0_g1_i1.p1  ORF type:complete len:944 (+),score=143.62 TRINITY_DN2870_c0_g1_i1:423-3254(+)